VRSIDIIANEDTIEMVLNESAMQMLSQAAAPIVPPSPPNPDPVLKEPVVPVAAGPAALKEPEVLVAAAPAVPPERRADPPERRAGNRPVHPPERGAELRPELPEVRRPPMSTLRFAILLGVVAVGSAIGTAVTYLATTGALRSGDVATSVVSRPPDASAAPDVPAASVAPPAVATATATAAPGAPVTATAPASVTATAPSPVTPNASEPLTPVAPHAPAAAPPPSPSVQPAPQPLPSTLASAASSAQSSLPSSAPSPATDSPPVRIVNPFDRKEVFEFPAGTSKADARDAVAELLYERAQDRVLSARGLVSGMGARHTTSASASAAPAGRKTQP
jgi:hypothetical protein